MDSGLQPNLASREGSSRSLDPEAAWERKEVGLEIAKALKSLKPPDRLIVILRYFEELSYDEIAYIMQTRRNSIEVRLFRARQKLRSMMTLQPEWEHTRCQNQEGGEGYMYTCREIEKLLDTYIDGELDEPRRLRVEAHLQGCALCGRLARCKEEEARLIRSGDPVPALSAGFTAQVMSNLTPAHAGYPLAGARGGGLFFTGKGACQTLAGPRPGRPDAPGDGLLGGVETLAS